MDVYLVTLGYNQVLFYLLLKFFQLWPLGAFSTGSFVPLTDSFFVIFDPKKFFDRFLTFWHNKMLQARPVYSYTAAYFPQETPVYGRMASAPGLLLDPGASLLSLLSGHSKEARVHTRL